MDYSLRCNSLKCRTQLKDRAVVTTCSHIFCVPCSQSLEGLAKENPADRTCPACQTQLINPDDAVVTQLNPTEDYKTSVLSGLNPNIIMECAGRGMSFFTYQTSQEILYQEFLARSLTDKYSTLSTQMDSVIAQANGQINTLQEKLQAMHIEQKNLEQKNHELQEQYRNKARSAAQLKRLYDKLKAQQVAGGLELAAEHEAEDSLHVAGGRGPPLHSRASSGNSGNGGRNRQTKFGVWEQQQYGPGAGDRNGLHSARSMPQIPATPSHHRTQLPAYGNHVQTGLGDLRQGTPNRPALQGMDPNIYAGQDPHGYRGMSAGVKVGRQQSGPFNRNGGVGMGRPGGVGAYNMR